MSATAHGYAVQRQHRPSNFTPAVMVCNVAVGLTASSATASEDETVDEAENSSAGLIFACGSDAWLTTCFDTAWSPSPESRGWHRGHDQRPSREPKRSLPLNKPSTVAPGITGRFVMPTHSWICNYWPAAYGWATWQTQNSRVSAEPSTGAG